MSIGNNTNNLQKYGCQKNRGWRCVYKFRDGPMGPTGAAPQLVVAAWPRGPSMLLSY